MVSTRGSSLEKSRTRATISRPKCLYTRPALESLVVNPWPKISSKPRWWWSKRLFSGSYTAPTSMTMSHAASTSGSRLRTTSAFSKAAVRFSRKHPSASSQWKDPSWVPIFVGAILLLALLINARAAAARWVACWRAVETREWRRGAGEQLSACRNRRVG